MNILIRADSSSTIGIGHIMRDLVLAKQYKDSSIIFATQELDGNINNIIVDSGYSIVPLTSNDKEELITILINLRTDLLIIDHYKIDYQYEGYIKKNVDIKILSFDDTYEKHNCDILLNHNISADKKKYKNLVSKKCELRCGSKYTLLRDEFKKVKSKKQKVKITNNQSLKTIFLAMGGADHSNINIQILKVLKKFKNIRVNLVTTTANKNIEELKIYCKNKKWINLSINSNKIAKLMLKSDLAIVAPSVTVNEVYYMKIPLIAIMTANNQEDMYRYLKKKKYLVLKKFEKNKLKIKILKIMKALG